MRKKAVRAAATTQGSESLSTGLLILVELGAEWPGLMAQPGPRRVVAQQEGETPAQFAARAADLLDGLFGRGIALGTAVISCNERLDAPAEAARRKLASLTLGAMAKHKTGKLYLAAAERSSGRLRQALTALSQGLFDEWRTAGLEASVKLGDPTVTEVPTNTFAFTARVA